MPMTLVAFLRQWPAGRLVGGVVCSLLIHGLLVTAMLVGVLPTERIVAKRGEPLYVELPNLEEAAPRGNPSATEVGAPVPQIPPRAATPTPSPPPVRPAPPVPRPAASPPRAVASVSPTRPTETPPAQSSAVSKPAPPVPEPVEAPSAPSLPPAAVSRAEAEPPPAEVPSPSAPEASSAAPSREAPRVAALPPTISAPPAPAAPDIRSALRRGSGAGGRGDGRGGITGEPIPLDTQDPKYTDYFDRVRRRIQAYWGYPCVKSADTKECEYKTAQLTILFGISKDGVVPFVTVLDQSGYQIMDDYAVNAVKLASPFPPVPPAILDGQPGIPIRARFSYIIESSLTNLRLR